MIRRLSLLIALAATPAFAQDAANMDAMVAAVEEAGCLVTADNGDAVLEASGLSEDQAQDAVAALYLAGLVDLTADGNMKLTNEVCP